MHYSFDYAQQVLYPHYAQQVGPLYFKTPRKCGCFGVCCESSGSQIFYLVDEMYSVAVGRGANSVVSMVHHHFQHHGYGEKNVSLHMDNCTGQNKNNVVISYGMWRVMVGLHDALEYSLMEAGHTKFSPDWHFGLWKVRWRHSTAETLEDISKTVSDSSRGGHNIPQLVEDPTKPVVFYDWAKFLKQFFRPIPHLKKYYHFRMSSARPGVVFVKDYNFSIETEINILRQGVDIAGKFPNRITIPELDACRQWYLYNEIAPLCDNSSVCPKPAVPKPSKVKTQAFKTKSE
ncbi:uncharacterized protein LOC123554942 [Mercenaria mercenaria]|uniref:uncharacterized protein LOC123554942 n=1 Tax=Mercenaria mercenaria TaxID=6596 RepID=UPI00234E52B3|nr:uncharacterized protein LOC123554942 [Mercenaria mercenaria]